MSMRDDVLAIVGNEQLTAAQVAALLPGYANRSVRDACRELAHIGKLAIVGHAHGYSHGNIYARTDPPVIYPDWLYLKPVHHFPPHRSLQP